MDLPMKIKQEEPTDYFIITTSDKETIIGTPNLDGASNTAIKQEAVSYINESEYYEDVDDESETEETQQDIETAGEKALSTLLPGKSKAKYQVTYDRFKKWCCAKNVNEINEKVLVTYFTTELETFKASSTWSIYSMLKSTLSVNNNIQIQEYRNLKALLKRKSDGYSAKQSLKLKKDEVFRFIKEAPHSQFLAVKVALIIGVYGACRREELTKMSFNDIECIDGGIKVTVPTAKHTIVRQFVIANSGDSNVNVVDIVKRYISQRPDDVGHSRFFLNYRQGRCTRQPIGVNTISSYPAKIATFLGLPNANQYTGHCFRRSSDSFLADAAINTSVLHQIQAKDNNVENSLNIKRKIPGDISGHKIAKLDGQNSPNTSTRISLINMPEDPLDGLLSDAEATNSTFSKIFDLTTKIEDISDSETNEPLSYINESEYYEDVDEDSETEQTQQDIETAAEKALSTLLPDKSKVQYQNTYDKFKRWCCENNIDKINEKALLTYFTTELETFKASSTWSIFSILNSTLSVKDNIQISDFQNLKTLLKLKSDGYNAKQSLKLKKDEVFRFIKEAPDDQFLVVKVVLIVGVYGACRREELTKMSFDDIQYIDGGIKITIPGPKQKIGRQFAIADSGDSDVNVVNVVKRYINLRPDDIPHSRFFLSCRHGKCTRQPIGINTISTYPGKIATFLGLPNANQYTGHCFRRSSASFLAEAVISTSVSRIGGWSSDKVTDNKMSGNISSQKIVHQSTPNTSIQISSINTPEDPFNGLSSEDDAEASNSTYSESLAQATKDENISDLETHDRQNDSHLDILKKIFQQQEKNTEQLEKMNENLQKLIEVLTNKLS